MLLSWEKDPFPVEDSFAHFLTDYFQTCPALQIDSSRGGKLNYLRAKLPSPLFSPACCEDFEDGTAFLRRNDEENWGIVCEWTTLQEACRQLGQPMDSFLVMQFGGNLYSVQKPLYDSHCEKKGLVPYLKLNIPLPMFAKRAKKPTDPQNSQVESPVPLLYPSLPTIESPLVLPNRLEEAKFSPPNPSLEPMGLNFGKIGLIDKQMKDSAAQIEGKTKAAKDAIAGQIARIPVQPQTDPNLQGEAVGREVTTALHRLVSDKESAANDLCRQTSKQVAASMTDLVRQSAGKVQEYRDVTQACDQRAAGLAYRLQQVEQQLANARNGASIQEELAQLEAEIQGFEQFMWNFSPPPHFPLRIVTACGIDSVSRYPCPVLAIQWKDWVEGKQLRVALDAQGGIYPTEAVLKDQVTVLPYYCQENSLLIITSAQEQQLVCKQTVNIYSPQYYQQAYNYYAEWEINKTELENQQKALLAA